MVNKLRYLYALQQIDNQLDELEEMKGDLPGAIRDLEASLAGLQQQVEALERAMREAFAQRDIADSDIVGLREKMDRYRKQQLSVRNNREYDALTREMDMAAESVTKLEKEMEALEGRATLARTDIEERKKGIGEVERVLQEKRAALAELSKSTQEEELKHGHDREKVLRHIAKADLVAYERIRKAKRGKAVVAVRRGACGGCFAKVPPQKILELRQNKQLYTCEHCGRILVSDEVVESSSTLV